MIFNFVLGTGPAVKRHRFGAAGENRDVAGVLGSDMHKGS
jgi:hypothetical protein